MTTYTHKVKFTKNFTFGLLAGMKIEEESKFICFADAQKFVDNSGKVVNPCAGNSKYIVQNCEIVQL